MIHFSNYLICYKKMQAGVGNTHVCIYDAIIHSILQATKHSAKET